MKINLDNEAKVYLNIKNHHTLTVSADRECVGANCTEFIYPVVNYQQPDAKRTADYDRFDVEGFTVFFEKRLETVPEVTLKLEHHILRDTIRIEGLPTPPEMTHIHL